MSKVFLTCDLNNLQIVDGYPTCTQWEYMTPMFPMFELGAPELGALMAATTVFLAICFSGRSIVSMLFRSASSD